MLTHHLNKDPMFTALAGLPSFGKSALVNHVLDQKLVGRDAFHAICIDLHGLDVSNRYALFSALQQKSGIGPSLDEMWSAFSDAL
jgi:AAA+ ATPase superfamily predicted ATPase